MPTSDTLGLIHTERPAGDPLAPGAIAGTVGVSVAEVRGALIDLARLELPLRAANGDGADAA